MTSGAAAVEHHVRIAFEVRRELAPEICKRGIGQGIAAMRPAVIVDVENDPDTQGDRVIDYVVDLGEFCGIERPILCRLDSPPKKRQANHVHAPGGTIINVIDARIKIIHAVCPADRTKLGAAQIDNHQSHLRSDNIPEAEPSLYRTIAGN